MMFLKHNNFVIVYSIQYCFHSSKTQQKNDVLISHFHIGEEEKDNCHNCQKIMSVSEDQSVKQKIEEGYEPFINRGENEQSVKSEEQTEEKPITESAVSLKKKPITAQELTQAIEVLKRQFPNRSFAVLVIALYDSLKLWKSKARMEKAKLWYNLQQYEENLPSSHYSVNSRRGKESQEKRKRGPRERHDYLLVKPNKDNIGQNENLTTIGEEKSEVKSWAGRRANPAFYGERRPQLLGQPAPKKKKGRPSKYLMGPPQKGPRQVKVRNQSRNVFMPPTVNEEKERVLAEVYLFKGYGLSFAKNLAQFEVRSNNYYSHMRSIFYRSFLKLSTVMAVNCKMPTDSSRDVASSRFKSELCKSQDWLEERDVKTFQEYIRSVYQLQPNNVSKGDTISLYNNIMKHWKEVKKTCSKPVYRKALSDPVSNQSND